MPHGAAELAAELDALADASRDALTRLRAGDESELVALLGSRERLLEMLEAATVTDTTPALAEAARRAVALDGEIVAVLEQARAAIAQKLERLVSSRRSLASYGGSRDGSLYVERLV